MTELAFNSGAPLMKEKATKKKLQTLRDGEKKIKFDWLREDLESPGGEMIITKMKEVLASRIDKLIAEDPYCQGILQGLKEISADLIDGSQAATRIMNELVKVDH